MRGYGIGILPTKVAKNYGAAIRLIKIKGFQTHKFGTHRFYLSYREDLDVAQSTISLVLEAAKKSVAAAFY
jgi:hypothetical protein